MSCRTKLPVSGYSSVNSGFVWISSIKTGKLTAKKLLQHAGQTENLEEINYNEGKDSI